MSGQDPLLEVNRLSATYGHIQALKPTDLRIWAGEFVAILGPNGAGKSTLLKAIMRLVASEGSILFDKKSLAKTPTHDLAGLGIAMVPENRGILGPLTVGENLDLGAYARRGRASAAETEQSLDEIFTLFPRLKERLGQVSGSLSGGEQQMLAVARALMARPRLLLLDEPSLGLAPRIATEIFQALGALNKKGLTILVVEQKAPLALGLANHAHVMRTGHIIASLDQKSIQSAESLANLYLGQIQ